MAKQDKTAENKDLTVGQADAAAAGTALVEMSAYADYAGSGFENQTQDDYSIPFLTILQALSPQLLPEAGNDHLKQGMVFNTVTGDYFAGKEGITFIPATTQHEYIEFKPRDAGGGFVGRHEVNSQIVKDAINASTEFGKYGTVDGNELIETFAVYGVLVDKDGGSTPAVIAFSATKIKKYKGWMTKAKTIQIPLPDGRRIPAPLWSHRYRLKTASEKNNKGSFFNWDIAFDGENAAAARMAPNDPLAVQARDLITLIGSGKAGANYEAADRAGSGADDEGAAAGASGQKPVF